VPSKCCSLPPLVLPQAVNDTVIMIMIVVGSAAALLWVCPVSFVFLHAMNVVVDWTAWGTSMASPSEDAEPLVRCAAAAAWQLTALVLLK
jgi:hypothetical protein